MEKNLVEAKLNQLLRILDETESWLAVPLAASALSHADRDALLASVDWRNELIHEYEPEASHEVFYAALKESLAAYRHYAQAVHPTVS